jgi:hypothetical protein
MSKIVFVIDDSMSYSNLNKNRLGLVQFLKQKGMPIIMSYVECDKQIESCQKDIDVSQIDPSAATPAHVSGGPIEGTTSGISA